MKIKNGGCKLAAVAILHKAMASLPIGQMQKSAYTIEKKEKFHPSPTTVLAMPWWTEHGLLCRAPCSACAEPCQKSSFG